MTANDPPVRPDGRCVYCERPRGIPNLRPLYQAAAAADPFCSTECARLWHGVPLLSPQERSPRGYTSKMDRSPGRV